ncbi:MAG: hypothetical protein KAJ14_08235, partial [Candidatus Omnitrophica bacterium]|nr:hypothetical protein [Candidatus Omnitrophota bacterium]
MDKLKIFIKNKKNLLILFLSILCALKIPQGGGRFFLWIAGGILTCVAMDILLNGVFRKKKISVQSAVITGFIVSGVLDYSLDWYLL